jgi:hypothetical protein
MSNHKLATYYERRSDEGPFYRLEIERGASGKPDLLFTIFYESYDGTLEKEQLSILVVDADRVLAPVIEYCKNRRSGESGR